LGENKELEEKKEIQFRKDVRKKKERKLTYQIKEKIHI
jgi:hypothetical protein